MQFNKFESSNPSTLSNNQYCQLQQINVDQNQYINSNNNLAVSMNLGINYPQPNQNGFNPYQQNQDQFHQQAQGPFYSNYQQQQTNYYSPEMSNFTQPQIQFDPVYNSGIMNNGCYDNSLLYQSNSLGYNNNTNFKSSVPSTQHQQQVENKFKLDINNAKQFVLQKNKVTVQETSTDSLSKENSQEIANILNGLNLNAQNFVPKSKKAKGNAE